MHSVVLEIQEANKDVLVGKRNVNCLSCGIKDGQATSTQAHTTINGKDGRIYRGVGNTSFDVDTLGGAKEQRDRVASANPRTNRISHDVKSTFDSNFATGGQRNQHNKLSQPYGISTEIRKKAFNSRMSTHKQMLTSSHNLDTSNNMGGMPDLSNNPSGVTFPSTAGNA